MHVLDLHSWSVGTTEARGLQRDLATRVVRSRCLSGNPRYVAGADLSVDRVRGRGRAAVVVVSYPGLQTVEVQTAEGELGWPYVPGYLSFREAPLVLAACRKLEITPDMLIVDGQGVAHPRGLGLASHLGLFLDIPTIGCAKSLLCGAHGVLDERRGAFTGVVYDGEVVGAALRTR